MAKYTLYTKFCVKCLAPKELEYLKIWCEKYHHELTIERTSYRPKLHELATIYWGEDTYTMFVRNEDTGENTDFRYFIEKLKSEKKAKTIKKAKPVSEGTKK